MNYEIMSAEKQINVICDTREYYLSCDTLHVQISTFSKTDMLVYLSAELHSCVPKYCKGQSQQHFDVLKVEVHYGALTLCTG